MRQLALTLTVFVVIGCGSVAQQQSMVSCSTTRGSSGQMCDATYSCFDSGTNKTSSYAVRCSRPGSTGDFSCDCLENGVKVKGFVSIDFCSSSDHKAAAATGCGWRLE